MRRFRLIKGAGYPKLREGVVYDESFTTVGSDFSVIQTAHEYPEDWEEVFDEPKRLHKDTDLGYFAGLALQGILSNPHSYIVGMGMYEIVQYSVDCATELIEALDKEVNND